MKQCEDKNIRNGKSISNDTRGKIATKIQDTGGMSPPATTNQPLPFVALSVSYLPDIPLLPSRHEQLHLSSRELSVVMELVINPSASGGVVVYVPQRICPVEASQRGACGVQNGDPPPGGHHASVRGQVMDQHCRERRGPSIRARRQVGGMKGYLLPPLPKVRMAQRHPITYPGTSSSLDKRGRSSWRFSRASVGRRFGGLGSSSLTTLVANIYGYEYY